MADEIPNDVRYVEMTFSDGVVHRIPVTPDQARRWVEGKKPIAYDMNGEPSVADDGRLIEEHRNTMDPEDDAA